MLKKLLFVALLTCATLSQADYIMKYDMDGEMMEFYYKNSSTSKMLTNSEDGKVEIYHKNKNSFLVTHTRDGVSVVDVNKLKAQAKAMGFDASMYNQAQKKPNYKVQKTGKRVKVAGIRGEVWILKGKENGRSYSEKVVVTNNKKVLSSVHGMFKAMASMSNGMGADTSFIEPRKGYVIIKANGIKLTSFRVKNLASATYKVPKVTNTREAFNERNKQAYKKPVAKKKNHFSLQAFKKPACYKNLCCSKIAGESVVLKASVPTTKGAEYKYIDSATCVKSRGKWIEEALYVTNDGKPLLMRLDMKYDGVSQLEEARKADFEHSSDILLSSIRKDRMKVYHVKRVKSYKMTLARVPQANEERMEIYIKKGVALNVFRPDPDKTRGWSDLKWVMETGSAYNKPFYAQLEKALAKRNYKSALKRKKSVKKVKVVEPKIVKQTPRPAKEESGPSDDDINKAANMLKGFF